MNRIPAEVEETWPTLGMVHLSPVITLRSTPIPLFSLGVAGVASRATQRLLVRSGRNIHELQLPKPRDEVIPGVLWGHADEVFTPAYWRMQDWLASIDNPVLSSHAIGRTLREEVAACLLAGYGVPAEIGLSAFNRLREVGLLGEDETPSAPQILAELIRPLHLRDRIVRYRFAAQKSAHLSVALQALSSSGPSLSDPLAFRAYFLELPGFGSKTASLITRNWLGSDAVAIIDIHINRAGLIAGVFAPRHLASRDYEEMEGRFLRFAWGIGVRASRLDAIIWRDMRRIGPLARRLVARIVSTGKGNLETP